MDDNTNKNDNNKNDNNKNDNNKNEKIENDKKEEFGISNKEIAHDGVLRSNSVNINENNIISVKNISDKDVVELQRIKSNISRTSTKNSLPPPERRKNYQVRAMIRKTLAYQKRQMGTNICCVGACPTMMIIIAFLLSLLVEHLLKDLIKTEKYEYCTKEFNGDFVLPNSEPQYKKDEPDVHICHYSKGSGSSNQSPCSNWFGTNDYFESYPYDILPDNYDSNINRDTLFMPPLDKSGNYQYMINMMLSLTQTGKAIKMNYFNNHNKRASDYLSQLRKGANLSYIINNMLRPWGFIAINKNNSTEKALIGERNEGPSNITIAEINSDKHTLSNKGYLDYTFTRYFLNLDELKSETPSLTFERVPYFEILEVEDDKEIDDLLAKRIRIINKMLSNTTFDDYTKEDKEEIDFSIFQSTEKAIEKSVDYMPYGVVYFENLEEEKLKYDIMIYIGENAKLTKMYSCTACTVSPYVVFPGRGKRLLYFITELTNSIIKKVSNNKYTITQGLRSFPEKYTSGLPIDLASLIGIILFPWGVSFLLPIFIIGLVKEKEERFLVMMNMNGMKSITYYVTVYITNLILSVISMIFFNIAGIICGMNMFVKTSLLVMTIVFIIWANVQVIMSFVLSFFFKRNGTALISSFLIVLLSIVFSLGLSEIFESTYAYFIWPPFAFYFILSKFSTLAVSNIDPAYQLHNFIPGDRVFNATMYLIVDSFILIILAVYFNAVIPQEFGSHQPWHLNIVERIKKLLNKNNEIDIENVEDITVKNPFYTEEEANDAKTLEDDDVRTERNRILSGKYDHNSPLIIKNIRKEYAPRVKGGKPHVAVHSVTFAVEEGVVFGLLGPNGAGKTTLIHSLIGVYTPTNGYAKLAGYNIKTDMDQVYKRIGICPQHDILWNDLTVLEHLLFYARLKGIPKDQEYAAVQESMESVGLENFKDNLVNGLSGGEKRRLSIAIALVGDPKLVFLDEPTTGLDPDIRRLIWGILNEISHNRTIIITTHSMEEAEVLCHRIGIMSHGTLRCCATQLRLKELYGSGFKLSYSNDPKNYKELKEFIINIIPKDHKVVRDLTSTSIYEFIPTQGLISKLFELLEENKEKYGIIDWGISQSSLEEVFLSIISDDDADAS
ncbi:hypothetical protein BCR32DRAFT_266561 [Anaeromyces robustus]|uniref:ABC transporter domain-containing protein n=1 Tax=Anaeromyces robustus TaxID=1754192 RepID=A0A1Y1XE79_9FUNG|nr:hypothetical protein BCR32DRAFT_266561 [Anaeromyces robustus]|eukprot:ORX84081.1 hypothetical protein BCR32DRAFT_266561 [Anaeromyces robustus]